MNTLPVKTGARDLFQLARRHLSELIFASCCVVVVAISVHDAMLVVLHRSVIHQFEQNPCGRWLMELQGGDVSLFVWTKFAGTAVVCTVLIMLYQARGRLALGVGGGLAVCQMTLLWYLSCG